MSTAPYGRAELMVTAAVRYCLGRSSYIVGDCCDWLIWIWPTLLEETRTLVKRDIEEAFADDIRHRSRGVGAPTRARLGDECDRRDWERVRALWGA